MEDAITTAYFILLTLHLLGWKEPLGVEKGPGLPRPGDGGRRCLGRGPRGRSESCRRRRCSVSARRRRRFGKHVPRARETGLRRGRRRGTFVGRVRGVSRRGF